MGDLAQGGVVEDHVGGDVLLAGDAGAPLAQDRETRGGIGGQVDGRYRGGRGLAAALAPAFARGRLGAQLQAALAAQQRGGRGGETKGTVAFDVRLQQAVADQLPEHATPLPGVEVAADAIGADRLVPELAHLGGVGAAQHVDHVRRAEALAGAVDAGQRLARGLGGVPGAWRLPAVVAVAAGPGMRLAEVRQQRLPATPGGFAVTDQRVELAALQPLALVAGIAVFDHPSQQHRVAQSVGQPRLCGIAIAAGAAGFLVIAFQRFRQVEVGHEAHVGLVDAHAEGDRRHHHDPVLAQEAALVFGAGGRVQAGVVRQRTHAAPGQQFGGGIDLAPRQAIDDAAVAAMVVQELQQLAAAVVLGHHRVADVRTVERTDELARVLQRQPLHDLAPGRRIRGGGQSDPRHVRPALVQQGQLAVFGAEIVAPLGDAMRLVDREQRDRRAFQQ